MDELNHTTLKTLREERDSLDAHIERARQTQLEIRKAHDKAFAAERHLLEERQLLSQKNGWLNTTALFLAVQTTWPLYSQELHEFVDEHLPTPPRIDDIKLPTKYLQIMGVLGARATVLAERALRSRWTPTFVQTRPWSTLLMILFAPYERRAAIKAARLLIAVLRWIFFLVLLPWRLALSFVTKAAALVPVLMTWCHLALTFVTDALDEVAAEHLKDDDLRWPSRSRSRFKKSNEI